MKSKANQRYTLRKKRALRVRKKLKGTAERPRLSVKKTNRHLFVQLIDDEAGKTLGQTSTLSRSLAAGKLHASKENAKKLGEEIAKVASEKSIEQVVFDRGASCYHGILQEFAQSAREHGLKF